MKCPHHSSCKNYDSTSPTCNLNSGIYYEESSCGTYRELSKKSSKFLILAFILSFIILGIGAIGTPLGVLI